MSQVLKPKKGYKLVKGLFGKEIEIPKEWDNSNLKNSLELLKDGTHNPPARTIQGIPLLSSEDIHDGIVDFEKDVSFISEDDYVEMQKNYEITLDDILLTVVGTLGRVSLVKTNQKFAVQRSVAILRTNEKINHNYLYNFIQTSYFQKQMDVRKNATAQSGVYLGQLSKIQIIYPSSLQEQQKISLILSNIDNLISNTQKIIDQIILLKKGLMQKLLTKGIGHKKFKKVSLRRHFLNYEIPEDWNIEKIGDFSLIIDTPHYTSPNYDNGIPIIRTSDCNTNGRIDYSKTKFTSKLEYEKRRKQIDPDRGDILFTREAPCGIAVLVDKKEIAVGQRIILLKTDFKQVLNSYIVLFLNSFYGTYQTSIFAISTTVERVNISEIKKFLVPLPPLPEQQKIASILSNVGSQIQSQTQYKEKLERLKKSLMQKLLSGQVRVTA